MASVSPMPNNQALVQTQQCSNLVQLTPGDMSCDWNSQRSALQTQVQFLGDITQSTAQAAVQLQQRALAVSMASIDKWDVEVTTEPEREQRAHVLAQLGESTSHWHQKRASREQFTDERSAIMADSCQEIGDVSLRNFRQMGSQFGKAIDSIDILNPEEAIDRLDHFIDLSEKLGDAQHDRTMQVLDTQGKVCSAAVANFYDTKKQEHQASVDQASQVLQELDRSGIERINKELNGHQAVVQSKITQYGNASDLMVTINKNNHLQARQNLTTLRQNVDLYDHMAICALKQQEKYEQNDHQKKSNILERVHQERRNTLKEEEQKMQTAAEDKRLEQERAAQAKLHEEGRATMQQQREDEKAQRQQEREDARNSKEEEREKMKQEREDAKEAAHLAREAKKAQASQDRADREAANKAKIDRDDREQKRKHDSEREDQADKAAANKAQRDRDDREQGRKHDSEKEAELQRELAAAVEDYHRKMSSSNFEGVGHPPYIRDGKVVWGRRCKESANHP